MDESILPLHLTKILAKPWYVCAMLPYLDILQSTDYYYVFFPIAHIITPGSTRLLIGIPCKAQLVSTKERVRMEQHL